MRVCLIDTFVLQHHLFTTVTSQYRHVIYVDILHFPAHIFFDDAFEGHEDNEYNFTVNEYVKMLIKSVEYSGRYGSISIKG